MPLQLMLEMRRLVIKMLIRLMPLEMIWELLVIMNM